MLYLINPGWVKNRRWSNLRILTLQLVLVDLEKTDDISRRHQRFAREMTSEKREQKFHVNDASLPRSGYCFWLVVPRVKFALTNQKHYPDLGSDTSSVWNFCALSQTSFRGWRREMSSVFSGSTKTSCQHAEKGEISHTFPFSDSHESPVGQSRASGLGLSFSKGG